ncbi:MAG TPA: EAL domain-containing protein [Vicinamibacterales bacterium]|jgi:diguanylate cyclase (GGDEF)-like protein/PAS domain S-box-containing protein|nr:EAL domain-containing protein [Vicinamibacterales bacterium]
MNAHSGRVLVVDDNENNREILARRLTRSGYTVSVMDGAAGILDRIKDDSIDLVLLDIEMPGITGLDALVSIREHYTAVRLPVIMVTARSQSEDIVKALELGANDYVTKPIDFPVTLARVRTHVSHLRAEQALRASEERYALAARGANDGLWDWNLKDDTLYFSPRWKAMLGYGDNDIGPKPEEWFDRVHEADRLRVKQNVADHLAGRTPHLEVESRMLHKDGVFRWMLTRGLMIADDTGAPVRMAGSQTDITEGKVADPMTGLPNRLLFLDRLSRVIARRRRHPDTLFAVMFLDLDGFKLVNDSLGHAVGDRLLVQVARRLEGSLRQSDTIARLDDGFTIARLGGDEFAIIINDLKDTNDANLVAERLINEFGRPFLIGDRELFSSLSIGIALSTLSYQDPEDYLRDADTAMYRAKAHGKGRYEVFDTNMRNLITRRLEIENDLRRALERDEFRNYYQPIISLESGRIVSFEALLRWEHPTRGLLEPIEFIPVAEESGMIRELGWWALAEASHQIATWRALHPTLKTLSMCVNLSVKQFMDPSFGTKLEGLLREVQLPEGTLKLELTESSLMGDSAAAVALLSQVKALGVRLAIDDFGTGYSSLSYLHRFPLDTLKIDRSFTDAISNDPNTESMIARTIMPLAQHLGLDVVAEGVETIEQATHLKELRCNYAQGFLFSRPVRAEDILALLAKTVDGLPLTPHDVMPAAVRQR